MAERLSDQFALIEADPSELLDTTVSHGRVRRQGFTFTVPVGNAAIADTIKLCQVPAGARIYGGKFASQAMTSGGAAASVQLGDGTTAAKYLGTTSVDAAAEGEFAHTAALNFMEKLTGELTLTATVLTEAWAAGQEFKGYIDFVLD